MQNSCHSNKFSKNNKITNENLGCRERRWCFWQTVGLFAIQSDALCISTDAACASCYLWAIVIAAYCSYNSTNGFHTDKSMANERSFPVRFALGVWHFVNGSRKVFLNLLFLFFVYLVFIAFQPAETYRLKPDSTLVIRPYGNVVEQF